MGGPDEGLAAEREQLMRRAVGPEGDPLSFVELQASIAGAIRRAEQRRRDDRGNAEAWRTHVRMLRQIGDTMAWCVLDEHAIRNLSSPRSARPGIDNQWEDLREVLDFGRRLAAAGLICLLPDVTNVLHVGDLVCVRPSDAAVLVLECKRSRPTGPSGRLARQVATGSGVAEYLRTGRSAAQTDGRPTKLAIQVGKLVHDYTAVRSALEQLRNAPSAIVSQDENGFVIASRENQWPGAADSLDLGSVDRTKHWHIGLSADLASSTTAVHPPMTLWDIDVDDRIDIWAGRVNVLHAVAAEAFIGRGVRDVVISGVERGGALQLRDANGTSLTASTKFTGMALYRFVTPESAANCALEAAAAMADAVSPETSGIDTTFGVAVLSERRIEVFGGDDDPHPWLSWVATPEPD